MNRVVRMATVLLVVLAAAGAVAASKAREVDFTGTWNLDMKRSKGAPDWRPETVLVVLQSPHQIHFTYFLNKDARQPFESHDYVTNGKETKLYVTGNEEAYASVRWTSKNVLQVQTHHLVRHEIADTDWTETDTWTISNDGKTLTNRLSDGKLIVYDRAEKDEAPQH